MATVVHPSQRRRVELSLFSLYPLPSSRVRIKPMVPPPRLHWPHLRRRLLPLQGASRTFLPPSPRGKFSCPHGLNPRLTRVF
jgi:hypothetical protein